MGGQTLIAVDVRFFRLIAGAALIQRGESSGESEDSRKEQPAMTIRTHARTIAIAAGLAAVASASTPAAAREESVAEDAVKQLGDPQVQFAASAALAAMVEAVLDMNIGPFARAARTMGGGAMADLPDDARLRDLAGPDADDISGDVARNVPRAMGSAAEMAGAIDGMMPQFKEMARRMKDAIPTH